MTRKIKIFCMVKLHSGERDGDRGGGRVGGGKGGVVGRGRVYPL